MTRKFLDNSMEDDAIVVPVLRVLHKVLDRLRCVLRVQSEMLRIHQSQPSVDSLNGDASIPTMSPFVVCMTAVRPLAAILTGCVSIATVCSSLVGFSLKISRSPPFVSLLRKGQLSKLGIRFCMLLTRAPIAKRYRIAAF